jgi:uncharacterized protein
MKKFLTADWRDLIMANYEVSPEILNDFVPKGVSLDLHEGQCFVSLVAFMFVETRVLGVAMPFHTDFEEANLRFYVKRKTKNETRRGVTFIKEIVPRWAIATVARMLYGEPYEALPMSHEKHRNELKYAWQKNDRENSVKIEFAKNLGVPAANSHEEFIIEHYWGYTKRGVDRTDEYKIEHPKWELFEVNYAEIDVDFGAQYGEAFAHLSNIKPHSIFMAKGSNISLFKGERLKAASGSDQT